MLPKRTPFFVFFTLRPSFPRSSAFFLLPPFGILSPFFFNCAEFGLDFGLERFILGLESEDEGLARLSFAEAADCADFGLAFDVGVEFDLGLSCSSLGVRRGLPRPRFTTPKEG